MYARREAVERSEILDGHRSEGYGNVGGSDPCHNGSLPPFIRTCPRPSFGVLGPHLIVSVGLRGMEAENRPENRPENRFHSILLLNCEFCPKEE